MPIGLRGGFVSIAYLSARGHVFQQESSGNCIVSTNYKYKGPLLSLGPAPEDFVSAAVGPCTSKGQGGEGTEHWNAACGAVVRRRSRQQAAHVFAFTFSC